MNRKLKESGTFTSHTKLFDADVNRYGRQYAGGKDIENIFNELEHEADRDYAKAVTDEIEKLYSYLDEENKLNNHKELKENINQQLIDRILNDYSDVMEALS